ncbi:MAG TPA: M20/M25/M40 family metallo-hydrolase [Vicinamibacterales bacterium]|nr:M20/M25/M40 family metallo-hydrolase [Vicinamibacterales bacterium]
MRRVVILVSLLCLPVSPAVAQQEAANLGPRLLQDAAIKAAVEGLRASEPQTIDDQIRLCEVEAPPFKETKRAELYAQMFKEAGLTSVRIDKEGNVLGEKRGTQAKPHLVFSAHLDTVFPEGTDVTVKREGTMLRGPGIGDDCRGLAVVLAVARAMVKGNLQTPGTITFVGTVGEEGLGDLRGVKYLFREGLEGQIDRFVSIDGTGLGITHVAVGSLRYRVTFKGPGGHSYGAFGMVNPIHALGRAMSRVADFEVPREPKTTFNVGRIGGGTSVNSIPFEAWAEVDMRSVDPAALKSLDAKFHKAMDDAVADENARWGSRQLTVDKQLVGDRPAGRTAADDPVVVAAVSATKALGLPVTLDEGSTDSNIPMNMGIPAITIDGGGRGSGAHALQEAFDTTNSWHGTQRALLIALALAQP